MKTRKYYLLSILSVVVALGFHCVGREQMTEGQHLKAISVESAVQRHEQATPDPAATRLSNRGQLLDKVGFAFTLCCLICLAVALFRREPGRYAIPVVLLLSDIVCVMLL